MNVGLTVLGPFDEATRQLGSFDVVTRQLEYLVDNMASNQENSSETDLETLFALTLAANFLDMKDLLDLVTRAISLGYVKGQSPDDLSETSKNILKHRTSEILRKHLIKLITTVRITIHTKNKIQAFGDKVYIRKLCIVIIRSRGWMSFSTVEAPSYKYSSDDVESSTLQSATSIWYFVAVVIIDAFKNFIIVVFENFVFPVK
ncbi:unnamed protein product [Trichogramma brassicae]|uniref:Uncharacterized protein n=1 Tax=Trichogramma brassicae TaxID=86971 RepID=A0A6H5IFE6_9HYME|nr:unnamed protein product [Trichogramma brassicae]